jgi:dTDP-4-amino-4,6-dideoxygalactose transaminase
MLERGVETAVHYRKPPHLQHAYAEAFRSGQFPVAEQLASEVVSLPVGPELGEPEAQYVARCIEEESLGIAA